MGDAARPLRHAGLRRAVRRRDPLCRGWLRDPPAGRMGLAALCRRPRTGPRRRAPLPRPGRRAARRRAVPLPGARRDAPNDRVGRSEGLLRGRDSCRDRGDCQRARRLPRGGRSGRGFRRLGRSGRHRLSRRAPPGDPAERARHHGADPARHPGSHRALGRRASVGRAPARADRGRAAGLQRAGPSGRRSGCHDAADRDAAVAGLRGRPRGPLRPGSPQRRPVAAEDACLEHDLPDGRRPRRPHRLLHQLAL